jgi:hypothetical protein
VPVGEDGQVPARTQRLPIDAPPRSTLIRCLRSGGDTYYLRRQPEATPKPIVLLHGSVC